MTRAELINHLEHLAEYVKYSEDAPALREAIALLKTHEERTETHACDLIKRQDAIDAVNSIDNLDAKARGGICFKLMGLPPAQPEQQWIPCSERMPDPFVEVLVSDVDGDVRIAYFENLFNAWWSDRYGRIEVLAWMPLPEPYKERREDG